MRPLLYMTGRGKPHRWTVRDRCLAEGLEHYERDLNEIGLPSWIAQDPLREFEVDETVDASVKALDEAREEYRKGKNNAPGMRLVVIDKGLPDDVVQARAAERAARDAAR